MRTVSSPTPAVNRPAERRCLITGIAGQDGQLLAELAINEGYEVYGTIRRRIDAYDDVAQKLARQVTLVEADLLNKDSLVRAIRTSRPHEIYNLASPSFVPRSWDEPVMTAEFAAVGVTSLLEAIRESDSSIRYFQASSSEIFGDPHEVPQSEHTPLSPLTPYGVAKAYAHFITSSYRRRYGMFACCGILYNHESPRRPLSFLPRKVAHGAAAISLGIESELVLGDLEAARDWGYAGDYVRAMWLMLKAGTPDDYVVATGELHTVKELVDLAFSAVGLNWEDHVRTSPALARGRAELHNLVGNPAKAERVLGWRRTIGFAQLVQLLVTAEVESLARTGIDPATAATRT